MEQKKIPIKKDRKLFVVAHLLWWIIFFFVSYTFFELIMNKEDTFPSKPTILKIVLAGILAILLDLINYYIILPRVFKQDKIYRAIILEVHKEGYSQNVIDKMEEQLRLIKGDERYDYYCNMYALYLADAYGDLREFDRAWFYINSINLTTFGKLKDVIILKSALPIIISAKEKNMNKAEYYMNIAQKVFRKYKGKDLRLDYTIDLAYLEFNMLKENYKECEEFFEKYKDYDELKFVVYLNLVLFYQKQGHKEEAEQAFKEANQLVRNDYMKRLLYMTQEM